MYNSLMGEVAMSADKKREPKKRRKVQPKTMKQHRHKICMRCGEDMDWIATSHDDMSGKERGYWLCSCGNMQ